MKWMLGVTLLVTCYFGGSLGLILTKQDVESTNDEGQVDCDKICRSGISGKLANQSNNNCWCLLSAEDTQLQELVLDDNHGESNMKSTLEDMALVLSKRDTLENLIAKNKKNRLSQKNSKTFPIEKPRKRLPQKKLGKNVTPKPKIKGFSFKPPTAHKELQERFRDLKARMSAKPQMRTRGDFNGDERPNLIEQFKTKQEELREKIKMGNFKPAAKSDILKASHVPSNRVDIDASKPESIKDTEDTARVGSISSTTGIPKVSNVPVIVLTSFTTTSSRPPPIRIKSTDKDAAAESNPKKMEAISSALERIKEKQKEAVTKIKDKISTGVKSRDKDENSEKDNNNSNKF